MIRFKLAKLFEELDIRVSQLEKKLHSISLWLKIVAILILFSGVVEQEIVLRLVSSLLGINFGDIVPPPPPQNEHEYYPNALAFVMHWEGGYVCHIDDPGGATNMGITQRAFDEWQKDFAGRNEFNTKDVKDLKFDEAREIYYQNYWMASGADRMPWPLCLTYFDTAVNFGITGAVRFVQEALSILEDGIWGPQTQATYNAACKECLAHLVIFARRRYRFQRVLEDKSQWVFLEGWLNRDAALLELVRQHLVLLNAA